MERVEVEVEAEAEAEGRRATRAQKQVIVRQS